MINFILFILAGIGITNLIVNSSLVGLIKNKIFKKFPLIMELLSCMMCTGFWVGIILGIYSEHPIVLMASTISILSYTIGIIMEYLVVSTAVNALKLPEDDVE